MADIRKKAHNHSKKAALLMTAILLCLHISVTAADMQVSSVSSVSDGPVIGNTAKAVKLEADDLSVSASSAIVIEASTGKLIWSKNCDERLPMASTTKIMTALVAIEACDITKAVEISPLAVGIEGSSIYLYAGERLTMEDLLYALLLESANDAAAAIAIEVGGSIENFADMMNKKAAELGLENTNFTNPHGLDDPEHFTTARDLAKIASYAMKNEIFRTIVSTYKKMIPLNETEGVRLLINHNKLLRNYDGAIGIKTGYTKKSGRCLVSAAERDGVEMICVTLDAPNDWQDHKNMLDHAFSLYEKRVLCPENSLNITLPVVGGMDSCTVVTNRDEISAVLQKNASDIKSTVELFRFEYAPISDSEPLGRIVYYLDGEVIGEGLLYAKYPVSAQEYNNTFWEWLTSLFE